MKNLLISITEHQSTNPTNGKMSYYLTVTKTDSDGTKTPLKFKTKTGGTKADLRITPSHLVYLAWVKSRIRAGNMNLPTGTEWKAAGSPVVYTPDSVPA